MHLPKAGVEDVVQEARPFATVASVEPGGAEGVLLGDQPLA